MVSPELLRLGEFWAKLSKLSDMFLEDGLCLVWALRTLKSWSCLGQGHDPLEGISKTWETGLFFKHNQYDRMMIRELSGRAHTQSMQMVVA